MTGSSRKSNPEKNFGECPVYNEMRSKLRFGDVLVVHDLSRFGRNKEEVKNEWEALIKEEIDIVVLNMPILDARKYKGKHRKHNAGATGKDKVVYDWVIELLKKGVSVIRK